MSQSQTTTPKLFQPIQVGEMKLAHRVVLAPLTRYRANDKNVHTELGVTYYSQRGSVPGTLLIAEATMIGPKALGTRYVPGLWNDEQLESWKKVVKEVHAKGSYIYCQLWAGGRAGAVGGLEEAGYDLHGVSAIPEPGREKEGIPRAMSVSEIKEYVELFTQAARNAVEVAGFDGVELHGANGYLIDQFIQDVSNQRTDEYGGSIENRARFALELVDSVGKAIGIKKTAIRLSPWATYHGMGMENCIPTFAYLIKRLAEDYSDLAYLHLIEPGVNGYLNAAQGEQDVSSNDFARVIWLPRPLSTAGRYYRKDAIERAEKTGELIAFGRLFISNPDLPHRLRDDLPLTKWDRKTYYTHDPHGYINYPFFGETSNFSWDTIGTVTGRDTHIA